MWARRVLELGSESSVALNARLRIEEMIRKRLETSLDTEFSDAERKWEEFDNNSRIKTLSSAIVPDILRSSDSRFARASRALRT